MGNKAKVCEGNMRREIELSEGDMVYIFDLEYDQIQKIIL